MNPDILFTTLN